ncbi:phosphonate metabolism protein/1,5-bisphosphokinase (PRPP-forming) PhnN [Pseudomonas sp. NPDC089743]|uniref:phosphonate metabolism protein/1,5-bisphosphokinase (PRPP-forming) PhnN n=1 Tax=Pseudomonas sp. NPDC089743 TaxID=3364471 RepID=UPI0038129C02
MQHDASSHDKASGRLIYLIGPSGSGKDSLIEAARSQLAAAGVEIARRVITRSAEATGEAAQSVTPQRFEAMRAAGEFAMHWQANGLEYGIPKQVDIWLAQGRSVLVNGSRGYLPEARRRYPSLLAVRLEVDPAVLRARLVARGREAAQEIDQRLARSARLQSCPDPRVHVLDNSGPLATAVSTLMDLLRQHGVPV